jgi:hypothetical protein
VVRPSRWRHQQHLHSIYTCNAALARGNREVDKKKPNHKSTKDCHGCYWNVLCT